METLIRRVGHKVKKGLLIAAFRKKPLLFTAIGLGVMLALKTERGKKVAHDWFPGVTNQ